MAYKFNGYDDTLKNTSYDKEKKKYLSQSDFQVINFEKYVNEKISKNLPKSDAFHHDNKKEQSYLIEFKNRETSNIKESGIHNKMMHSLLIFLERTSFKIQDTKESLTYLLVYGSNKEYHKEWLEGRASKNDSEIELANLKKFPNLYKLGELYFNKFDIIDASTFHEKYVSNWE